MMRCHVLWNVQYICSHGLIFAFGFKSEELLTKLTRKGRYAIYVEGTAMLIAASEMRLHQSRAENSLTLSDAPCLSDLSSVDTICGRPQIHRHRSWQRGYQHRSSFAKLLHLRTV